jgi:hypothetical protein
MTLFLVTVAAAGWIVSAAMAYFVGRDAFGAIKARRQLKFTIAERDAARTASESKIGELVRISGLLADSEKKRLEALARVGQMVEEINLAKRAIDVMKTNERGMLALQTTSNERIDVLTAELTAARLQLDTKGKEIHQLTADGKRLKYDLENERARVAKIKKSVEAA